MSDKKISELTNITGANLADADEFVVVDSSASETKAITWAELKEGLDTGTGFVRITGDTMTGNLSFGDNDKAIFGAGSDLQIYHGGSASYISDQGTGSLRIGAQDFQVMNPAFTEYMIYGSPDGALNLYYDNSKKLATTSTGVDVTGTVIADDAAIGGTAGVSSLDLGSSSSFNTGTTAKVTRTSGSGTGIFAEAGHLLLEPRSDAGSERDVYIATDSVARFHVNNNGDISFYEDTGTTPKFFWDASAESLGLGSTSPDSGRKLHIEGGDTTVGITLKDTAGSQYGITSDNNVFTIRNDGLASDRLVIDSSGNVGIGTSSPSDYYSYNLVVSAPTESGITINATATTATNYLMFADGTTGNERYRGYIGYLHASDAFAFGTSGTERMRIDSSGNLLVGKTTTAFGTQGARIDNAGGGYFTANGGISMQLNRLNSDGEILRFYKDGTTVGSIGTEGGSGFDAMYIANGDAGLIFQGYANDAIIPFDGSTLDKRDAAIDLGYASGRFKDLYLSGGVYLGGTGAANKLDDYEEGTWTPAWGEGVSASYGGGNYASYTKIGNTVHVYFYLQWSSKTGGSGGIATITGLPFSVNGEPAAYFYYTDGFSKIVDRGRAFSTFVQFGERSLTGLSFHSTNQINSSGFLIGNVTYQTNA